MKFIEKLSNPDILGYWFLFMSQCLLTIVLSIYFILLCMSFYRTSLYQQYTHDNSEFIKVKPVMSFIYGVISFIILIVIIWDLDFLIQFKFNLEGEIFAPDKSIWYFVTSLSISIPIILLFSAIIGNYARAFFFIHEIDSGNFFKGKENGSISLMEIILRTLSISVFLFIEICLKILSGLDIKCIDDEKFNLLKNVFSVFYSEVPFKFYELLFWVGISSFILYTILIFWSITNKNHFIEKQEFKNYKRFYMWGFVLSAWLIFIGLLVFIPNKDNTNVPFYIFTGLGIFGSYYMLRSIYFDLKNRTNFKLNYKKILNKLINTNQEVISKKIT